MSTTQVTTTSSCCPHCEEEAAAAAAMSPAPAVTITPSSPEKSAVGLHGGHSGEATHQHATAHEALTCQLQLQVTPYRKAVTRKRTYSYGTSVAGEFSARQLDFVDDAAFTGLPPAVLHIPAVPAVLPHALSMMVAGPPSGSEKQQVGAALRTDVSLSPVEDSDLGEQVEEEEDSEAELEAEVASDVVRWWTPAGWWAQIKLLLALAVQLISIMGMTTKWMKMLGRLILFSIALAPAWWLIGRTYFGAKYIKRGVRYGLNARNYVDLYLPHRITLVKPRSTSSAAAEEAHTTTAAGAVVNLCPTHRAKCEAAQQSVVRKTSVDQLSLVERLHLDALLAALGEAGPAVDANALNELNDGGEAADPTEVFAAQLAAGATEPEPTPAPAIFATPPRPSRAIFADRVHPLGDSVSPPGVHVGTPVLAPVVIFLTGGAWTIGCKAWGALLGLGLSAHGVLVGSVDYRNSPQGDIDDMIADADAAVAWVFRHAEEYGGDPKRIFLAGQSAGAHIGNLVVLQNVAALLAGHKTSWTSKNLAGLIGISGCYDLASSKQHFHDRGLPLWAFSRIMRSTTAAEFDRYSPTQLVASPTFMTGPTSRAFQQIMPRVLLIHGKGDKTVAWQDSHEYAKALQRAHVKVKARYYKNYSHTDPIIEGPLTGHDHLCHDLMSFINEHHQHGHAHSRPSSTTAPHTPSALRSRTLLGASPLALTPPISNNGNGHQTDACISRRGGASAGHSLESNLCPPPVGVSSAVPPAFAPASSSSSLSDLFASLCAPLAWCHLPAFMVPSRVRLDRRPSHLPFPYQLVDDVEDVDDEEEAAYAASAPAIDTTDLRGPLPLRMWRVLARKLGWLVPSVVQRASIKIARPFVRFLSASPPPPSSSPSPDLLVESPSPSPAPAPSSPHHQRTSSRYTYPLQAGAQLPRTPPHPLIPRVLIRIARWINPF